MAHRAKDSRLYRIASAQRLGFNRLGATACLALARLAGELLAIDGGSKERCDHREHTLGDVRIGLDVPRKEEPPDVPVAGDEIEHRLLANAVA